MGGSRARGEQPVYALLAAVPRRHLESALTVQHRRGRVALPALEVGDLRVAEPGTDVYLYAHGLEGRQLPAATWRARLLRWAPAEPDGRHADDGEPRSSFALGGDSCGARGDRLGAAGPRDDGRGRARAASRRRRGRLLRGRGIGGAGEARLVVHQRARVEGRPGSPDTSCHGCRCSCGFPTESTDPPPARLGPRLRHRSAASAVETRAIRRHRLRLPSRDAPSGGSGAATLLACGRTHEQEGSDARAPRAGFPRLR